MRSKISDGFKGLAFKWRKSMYSLEKLAYKAIDGKQIGPIIKTSEEGGSSEY